MATAPEKSPEDNTQNEGSETPSPSKTTKKSLGGGLWQIIRNGKVVSYTFRQMHKGKSREISLGSVSELTEEQARKEADKYRKTIHNENRKIRNQQLHADLAAQHMPCFKTYADAASFVRALEENFPVTDRETPDKLSSKEVEIYAAIWIMLLTPISLDDILQASDRDIVINRDNRESYWHLIASEGSEPYCVFLPRRAECVVDEVRKRWPNAEREHKMALFPELNKLKTKGCKDEFKLVLKNLWPQYTIDEKKFVALFEFAANQFSYFRSEFIRAYTKKQHATHVWRHYEEERRMLANWWASCIDRREFGFPEAAIPENECCGSGDDQRKKRILELAVKLIESSKKLNLHSI